MAPSPGSYAPSPSSALMASPMNVNMMGQRGPPSIQSVCSPNPTLNTPVMSASASPNVRAGQPDDQMYKEKLKQLSKYIDPLRKMIAKIESDSAGSDKKKESSKIRSLLEIISDSNRRCSMETLLKCEQVLEKMEFKIKGDMNSGMPSNVATIIAANGSLPGVGVTSQGPALGISSTKVYEANICQPLLDAIRANVKKPYFAHTLQRTFSPAVAAMSTSFSDYGDTDKKRKRDGWNGVTSSDSSDHFDSEEDEQDIPHVIQGEIAKLDCKFGVELDSLQLHGGKTIYLLCRLKATDLPCVPPIHIRVFSNYPYTAPQCLLDADMYDASPFLKHLHQLLASNFDRLSTMHSISTILNRWVSH
jgi:mediator of RNA polymerase II transcription subunit 15